MANTNITTNTLLDFKQEALYPETLIERLMAPSSDSPNVMLMGLPAVLDGVAGTASMNPADDSTVFSGPIVIKSNETTDTGTYFSLGFVDRNNNKSVLSLLNGKNSYSTLDPSVFSPNNSNIGLHYDESFEVAGNGLSLKTNFDDKFMDSSCEDGSTYIRTKTYDSSTFSFKTNYVSIDSIKPEIASNNSDGSTTYFFVGTSDTAATTITSLNKSCGSDPNATYIYWKNFNVFQSSDINLKVPVESLKVDLDALKNIDKFKFIWKGDTEDKVNIGVSAQSVEELYPELVSEHNGIKAVAYDKLVVVALAAIDKLTDKINTLENEIKELKKRQ